MEFIIEEISRYLFAISKLIRTFASAIRGVAQPG